MGACDTMFKYIVFLFNLVFFIAGATLIGIGAYIQAKMSQYLDFLGTTYLNTSIVIIIVGAAIVVVAFFGCCGACTESACMMYTFATLLVVILISVVGCAIAVYIYKDDVKHVVETAMTDGMKNYGKQGYDGVTETWDAVQHDFDCCGVNAFNEWKLSGDSVPDSCCKTMVTGCGNGKAGQSESVASQTIFVRGCFSTFETTVKDNVAIVSGIGIGLIVLVFMGVVIACCLARNMRAADNYV